jgi:hypothetical protein
MRLMWGDFMRRWAIAAVLCAAQATLPGTAQAATRAPAPPHRFAQLGAAAPRAATAATADDCGRPAATPVPDGQPIVVQLGDVSFTVGQINPASWRRPPSTDPSWQLWFLGFTYLPPLAARAYQDSSTGSLTTMVDQVVAFHLQDPDPGSARFGWDEGTAQRRLATENCLYALTHDQRLVPGMVSDGRVQLGSRYYGPPYHLVHNHGLMANLRLVRAGELLGRPAWITAALARMRAEAGQAFTAHGVSVEQSSMYQDANRALWDVAADVLAAKVGYASTVTAIRAMTAKARAVYGWETEPDGKIVQIGDADLVAGQPVSAAARVFRDDAAGDVIGRWSFTKPATTYYTLRYGPPRRAHGHFDRGSLTWSTAGARVLVGPGRFSYDKTQPWYAWQLSPVAHNAAVPVAGAFTGTAPVTVTGNTIQATGHAWAVLDRQYPMAHTRTLNVFPGSTQLRVADSFAGAAAFRQYWHLDPSWTLVLAPVNGQRMVFRNARGQELMVVTTGRLSSVQRGSTRPVAGWNFPAELHRVPACQLTIRSVGTAVTTFTVRAR